MGEPSADQAFLAGLPHWWPGDGLAAYETSLSHWETTEACFGLASSLWWVGDSRASVEKCIRT